MNHALPARMRAVALDRFGGPALLEIRHVPVPPVDSEEVLVRVGHAGVGSWDIFEREGGYAQMTGIAPSFPYILGSEGYGTVAAVGSMVRNLKPGDGVMAVGFLNPKGGFYAEYAAVGSKLVARVPGHLKESQAAAVGGVAITALRGLTDVLRVKGGESVAVLGASGGVGHLAVQFAKAMGARVLAVASGMDGVRLVRSLGADVAVDGREADIAAVARAFAPAGLDAVLLAAGGLAAEQLLRALRPDGRAAFPNGVRLPEGSLGHPGLHGYNGEPDADIFGRAVHLVQDRRVAVHVARAFAMEEAPSAHEALEKHHLGKIVLRIA